MKKREISPETELLLERMMKQPPRVAIVRNDYHTKSTTPQEIQQIVDGFVLTKNLGDLLRQARQNRKLSTRAMAAKVGVTQPRVIAVEKAQTQLEIETLVRFATAANYRVNVQLIPMDEPGVPISIELPSSKI